MMIGRRQLSLTILLLSGATMIAMSGARFVADGSFWNDEAAIAYNVISMSPVELLGPLDSGHQFPRLYLAVINQLRFVFGYETMVMRALPFAFFVAGVLLWNRLLWLRFRARPALLVLGCALVLVPGDWFAYGAMFKQYSLDAFVALLPFAISDAELDRRLRQGEGTPALLLWMLPCLVSYSYGIALLGRGVGYWLGTARTQGARPPLRPTAWLVGGFAAVMAASYAIDLRHAFAENVAFAFWQERGCIATGVPVADVAMVGHWLVDWLVARNPFGGTRSVPVAGVALMLVGAVCGAARVLAAAWRDSPEVGGPEAGRGDVAEAIDRVAWGTRALSALVTIGGLWAAGLLLAYPLCANRLTLFAYFSLVLLVLEGFAWLMAALEPRVVRHGPALLPLILAALVMPSAVSNVTVLLTHKAPQDLRPLLPIIATEPDRPIVVGLCGARQGLTLPEWLDRDDIWYVDERSRAGLPLLPEGLEFWLVSTGGGPRCVAWTKGVRARAMVFRPYSQHDSPAMIFLVRMPRDEP